MHALRLRIKWTQRMSFVFWGKNSFTKRLSFVTYFACSLIFLFVHFFFVRLFIHLLLFLNKMSLFLCLIYVVGRRTTSTARKYKPFSSTHAGFIGSSVRNNRLEYIQRCFNLTLWAINREDKVKLCRVIEKHSMVHDEDDCYVVG